MLDRFVRHRTLANLLMLIFIGIGLYSLPSLRRETFPEFDVSVLQIAMVYQGASAEDVEKGICLRIEDALDGVQYIEEVQSVAQEGSAVVTVEVEEGANVLEVQADIETEMDAITDFPDGAEDPVITQLNRTDAVMTLAVSGPMRAADLKDYCEDLKRRLKYLSEVSLVEVGGFSDRQLRIELDSDALRRLGLSASDIATTIGNQSLNLPVGTIESRDEDILLRFVEQRQSIREIEEIVISGVAGRAEIRVRDVGQVIDTFEDAEDQAWLDGTRCGILQINKTRSQDTTRVAKQVLELIEQERLRQPLLRIEVTADSSKLVNDRLSLLLKNAWQGMLLVFFAMWAFFNLRISFWVVMSLPVSFLAAFFLMSLTGQTINMMTSLAILMAIGVLMDDGIVIGENIARHLSEGKNAMRAAVDGVSEVAGGVFSSFLTTICVLGPLLVLEGTIGKVLQVVPLVLIMTLGVSLIEAFLILPAHLGHSLHNQDPAKLSPLRRRIEASVDWTRDVFFGSMISTAIRLRYLTIGTTVGLFILSLALFAGGFVGFSAFPDLEGDTIEAKLLLPQGTPLSKTESIVQRINDAVFKVDEQLAEQNEGQPLVRSVLSEFNKNTDASESGAHVATVTARILPPEERDIDSAQIVAALRAEVGSVADAISLSIAEPAEGPAGRAIEIMFKSDDLEVAKSAARRASEWLAKHRGVYNLSDDLRRGKLEVRLRLKLDAVGRGFNVQSLATQLAAAFQGSAVDDIQADNEQFEVSVKFRPDFRDSLDDFTDFHFLLSDGTQVPLEAVADLEYTYGWARIARIDGRRTVSLIGDTDTEVVNTSQLMREFQNEFLPLLEEEFPSVMVSFGGEVESSSETSNSMIYLFMLGLFGIYAILSYQFESWLEPLIVMFAIPMALIGVIFGHILMGLELSLPSLIGYVSLAGIVVNDSILLVLFLKKAMAEGRPVIDSAQAASRLRFRPIVLTSVTTVAGLLPLTLERSTQAQVLIPLANSIVFGIISSTVLILIVIPCIYVALYDLRLIKRAPAEH